MALWTAAMVLAVCVCVQGRYIRSVADVGSGGKATLLAGFGVGPGKGEWKFKAKVQRTGATAPPPFYDFCLYSVRSDNPRPSFTCSERHNTSALHSMRISLSSESIYSDTLKAELPEQKSAWHWQFYLALCDAAATEAVRVRYTLTLLGPSDSQSSVEEVGLDDLFIYLTLVFFLVFCYALYKFMMSLLTIDDVEGMLVILAFALVLELISFVFAYIHYAKLGEDGKGWVLFCFFSQFMDVSAYSFLVTIFLFVANGYYVKTKDVPSISYFRLTSFLLATIVLFILAQFEESTSIRNSDYNGVYGRADILLKCALLVWTLHCCAQTAGNSPVILQEFMKKFRFVCVCAIGGPGIAHGISLFAPCETQFKAFLAISRVLLAVSVLWFLRLLSTDGQYQKVAGKSEVLPSSKLHI